MQADEPPQYNSKPRLMGPDTEIKVSYFFFITLRKEKSDLLDHLDIQRLHRRHGELHHEKRHHEKLHHEKGRHGELHHEKRLCGKLHRQNGRHGELHHEKRHHGKLHRQKGRHGELQLQQSRHGELQPSRQGKVYREKVYRELHHEKSHHEKLRHNKNTPTIYIKPEQDASCSEALDENASILRKVWKILFGRTKERSQCLH
jgi:hypothetical protein